MLILTRRPYQSFSIGDDIVIRLIDCNDYRAKIGIEAPTNIEIWRDDCKKRLSQIECDKTIQQGVIDLMREERGNL